jgi:succinyl-CoA synthetase alpha subunit
MGRKGSKPVGILIDQGTRVLVQGITGREGSLRAAYMKNYGTQVVGGVSPGKEGTEVNGIPVYDTVEAALAAQGPVDFSVIFVPGRVLLPAIQEAADAGVPNLVACVESVPVQDIMVMVEYCKERGTRLLGPGTIGAITPGQAVVGWLGGSVEWANTFFAPGPIGVFSRSGGQSGTIPWVLSQAGFGVSTVIHTGTEPVIGTSMADLLPLFEADPQTRAVAVFSEIGGSQEEECARVIASGGFTKPFVIFVAGSWAPEGQRFSHASSIVERGRGSAKSKMEAVTKAGGFVAESPNDIPRILRRILG